MDGGRVETGSIFIGGNDVATHQNADGQVNVAGVGSVLKTNGNLVVGSPVSSIVGNLMISDRGTVDVGQTLTNMAGTGTITLSGGRIVASSIDHYHQMGFSSSNNSLFGQVTLHSGSLVHANQESETTFWGDVNIQTGVSLAGDGMVDFRGTLNIGNSPGIQEFGFNVGLLSSSTLRVEIGGIDISVPEYDQYIFLQDLELSSGTLLVELIGLSDPSLPYLPSLGDQFNIFQVDGVLTGTFGTIALPSLTEGLAWDVSQLYSHGQLSVVNAVPEPSSALTVLLVGLGLISHRRRKGNTAH